MTVAPRKVAAQMATAYGKNCLVNTAARWSLDRPAVASTSTINARRIHAQTAFR